MGRHRQTIEERKAKGTYKPTLHGPAPGCEFVALPPAPDEPPAFLDSWAREVWTRLYGVLSESQVLSAGEYDTFAAYCVAAGRYYRAETEITRSGLMTAVKRKRKAKAKTPPASFDVDDGLTDTLVLSAWYDVSRKAFKDMTAAARLLGLTSIDRLKIVKPIGPGSEKLPPSRPKTSLDKFRVAGRVG